MPVRLEHLELQNPLALCPIAASLLGWAEVNHSLKPLLCSLEEAHFGWGPIYPQQLKVACRGHNSTKDIVIWIMTLLILGLQVGHIWIRYAHHLIFLLFDTKILYNIIML